VFVALLVGCGGQDSATRPTSTTNPGKESRAKIVDVEAQRLCMIQQQIYATNKEMNEAYEFALNKAGLTEQEKSSFLAQRDSDKSLRDEISAKFTSICH
jgi:hypothetical protein